MKNALKHLTETKKSKVRWMWDEVRVNGEDRS